MSKGVPVGLTNLVYCKMLTDTPPTTVGGTDGSTTYGAATRISGAITANFSANASNDTLFADDGPYDTATSLGAMSLELNVADLPAAIRADLLGSTYDNSTGVVIDKSSDIPPFVAVGMSVKKSNGADRYIWYLKGKFAPPDENNQTKSDSINWNTPTITGNFLKRDSDDQWRTAVDTDDTNISTAIRDAWFSSPNIAVGTIVGAITATPVSGALSKAATAKVALACATAGATIEWKLSDSAVWNTYNSETQVPTTEWTAGSTVVVNARATLTGSIAITANFIYNVAA